MNAKVQFTISQAARLFCAPSNLSKQCDPPNQKHPLPNLVLLRLNPKVLPEPVEVGPVEPLDIRHDNLVAFRLVTALGIEKLGVDAPRLAPGLKVLPALGKRLAALGTKAPGGEYAFLLLRPVALDVGVVNILLLHALPVVLEGLGPQLGWLVTAREELRYFVGRVRVGASNNAGGCCEGSDDGGETHDDVGGCVDAE